MNNQIPFGWNPNMESHFPWQPQGNCNCSNEVRALEGRVNRLERQMRRLEDRVSRIEGSFQIPTPYNNNDFGNNSNYSSGYNMM